jgi:hypothetical protein
LQLGLADAAGRRAPHLAEKRLPATDAAEIVVGVEGRGRRARRGGRLRRPLRLGQHDGLGQHRNVSRQLRLADGPAVGLERGSLDVEGRRRQGDRRRIGRRKFVTRHDDELRARVDRPKRERHGDQAPLESQSHRLPQVPRRLKSR